MPVVFQTEEILDLAMGCFVKNWLRYTFMLECTIVHISVNDNVISTKVKLYKEVYWNILHIVVDWLLEYLIKPRTWFLIRNVMVFCTYLYN